jgi:hypothetical protein
MLVLAGCASTAKLNSAPAPVTAAQVTTSTTKATTTTTEVITTTTSAKKKAVTTTIQGAAVLDSIAGETSCPQLQRVFDQADINRKAALSRGNQTLADLALHYMQAADDRMIQLGCP